jgi:hypothetical protein
MGFGGFSWKRALGLTRAKTRLSRSIGIPLTRSGRQRKIGAAMTSGCGCCLLPALVPVVVVVVVLLIVFL